MYNVRTLTTTSKNNYNLFNFWRYEDAISVEQIVFVIAGLAVAIAIGWFIYNLVAGKADDASDIASDANSSKSAGSEFSGGAFGN